MMSWLSHHTGTANEFRLLQLCCGHEVAFAFEAPVAFFRGLGGFGGFAGFVWI